VPARPSDLILQPARTRAEHCSTREGRLAKWSAGYLRAFSRRAK